MRGSFGARDQPGDRATAPIEEIWCEKIRGCSYREATRPVTCGLPAVPAARAAASASAVRSDADHVKVQTEMLQLRLLEKKHELGRMSMN